MPLAIEKAWQQLCTLIPSFNQGMHMKILTAILFVAFFQLIMLSSSFSDNNRDSLYDCLDRAERNYYSRLIECGEKKPGSQQCIDECNRKRSEDISLCYEKYS